MLLPQVLVPETPGQDRRTRLLKRTLQGQLKKQGGATDKGVTLPLTPPHGSDDESCETPEDPDTRLGNGQLMSPSNTPSRGLELRFKRVKLSEPSPTEKRCLPWPVKPQAQHPRPVTLENIDSKIFADICSYLQPVEPGAPHYIYPPHVEDGRREILRRCRAAFTSVPGTRPPVEPPDSLYKSLCLGRTTYKFEKKEDDSIRRRVWLLLGVSRTLRHRYLKEILPRQRYIVNMLDLEYFAYLAATPPLKGDEGDANDQEVPPFPRLRFGNVSVFVPAGEKLPQLPLQPFYTLEKVGVSVNLVSQQAEERDPAMVATIKKVKSFLADYARGGEPLPAEYDNLHVFRDGVLYVKPSWTYLKKYRLDQVPRTIFLSRTSGLKLHDLLSDLRPLHTLTGSPVWLDMGQNIYNEQYEYLDPLEEYDEQSAIECEWFECVGSCVEQFYYTEGLGNHFILKNEALSTFNIHLINCIRVPLRVGGRRRSYIRLFHLSDDDNRAHPDEMRTRLYELLNSRGVNHCGMVCREHEVLKVEKEIKKGNLTLEELGAAISTCEWDGDVAWEMKWRFCVSAKQKAEHAKKWKSFQKPVSKKKKKKTKEVCEPNPDPDPEHDESENEVKKESGLTRWIPPKPKPVALRPPKGYATIKLQAWRDTSPLPKVTDDEVDEDDKTSDDFSDFSDESDKTPDLEYDNDKRWRASEWAQSESESSDPEADEETCPPITADEMAALGILDDEEDTGEKKEIKAEPLSSGHLSLAGDEDVDMTNEAESDKLNSSDDYGMDLEEDDD
ncbi:hypothetical protein F5883DRAFT_589701 [Diaporthe sp. PMI_573]|nr:hypothetical protein F5883DRAFT_589701 [Diaporthaceae sp. PMI_573]